nr:asparagine--tRNA ligase [Clostridioides difficile]
MYNSKRIVQRKRTVHREDCKRAGWIRTSRVSKNFGFIELNDGSFFKNMQIVFDEKVENFKEVGKLAISSSILVEGELVSTEGAKQPVEIHAKSIVVEGESDSSYPLQKKRHTLEYLRTIAHLRPRSNTFSAVFRVRSIAAYAIHKFFQERNFVYAHSPIITGSDCEGAGEMFRITTMDLNDIPKTEDGKIDYTQDFFGKEANLTVSGQLNAEIMALSFRNVYTFGPTFRAENSYTGRHASEFWMIEPEIVFADLEDNMELAEDMIKYVISYVLENAPEEMEFFNSFIDKGLLERLNKIVNSEFIRITYTKAVELLIESGHEFEYPVEWGCDLQTEHERYITEQIYNCPVFVTDYPKDIKAFYMRMNEDGKTVRAMDLLVPGVGEIVGGSQREEREDVLLDRINEMGLREEDYWWYLELRKFGTATHSGFGLGFERIIMYMTGMSNIRDVIPFPRTPKNAEF